MIPRFQHILVPVDFTGKNLAALDIAFEIAVQNQARVTLLHVIETIADLTDAEINDFYNRLETRANTELETMAQRFAEAGLKIDRKIRYGKRLREIVQDSIDRQIDLIVLSSHKIEKDQPVENWGTLSYQISVICQCPV
ncbi:MAG TPA: universal stress protein, partial [Planctomycetaceae bacterium]|nr:universal stress protein [Planctomycetaceae bacterium]